MNNCASFSNFNICDSNNTSLCNGIRTNCCSTGIRPYCSRDLCNHCGKCFSNCNCCCCPVVPPSPIPPMPPFPPMPPLPPLPPMPPIPPRPMESFGQFMAPPQMLVSGQPYSITNFNIQGDAIAFDPRASQVVLNPNTTYSFSYMTETTLGGMIPSNLLITLILDGNPIPSSEIRVNNLQPGVPTVLQANGQFMTRNDEERLFIIFLTNPAVQGLSSATLTITEILP